MGERNKFVRLVALLNELTQDNKLQWDSVPNPDDLNLGRDKNVGSVFETTYKGRRLRIYEEQYKYWHDEDSFSWSDRLVLTFVDANGNNEWELPKVTGIYDLLESVRYQSAGVDSFLNDVFSEDEESSNK